MQSIESELLDELTEAIQIAFAPVGADTPKETLAEIMLNRGKIYKIAGYSAESADEKGFNDVMQEYLAAQQI